LIFLPSSSSSLQLFVMLRWLKLSEKTNMFIIKQVFNYCVNAK
jgi:hypothetical protein